MATNRITEEELAAAGVMVDPDGNAVFIKDKESPDESWSLTQLALFILRADETAIRFGKAEAVERYYQGQAVHFAHKKCKELRKKWGVWCERNRIRRMTAWRSERLYLAAQEAWGEEAVNQVSLHTVTDLYLAFGILKKAERGHAPGIEQEVNGQAEDTSEDDQAADEAGPADLSEAHPAIRVHMPDEDEQDGSEDGDGCNIDLPEGVGDEPDPENMADDLPVQGVDAGYALYTTDEEMSQECPLNNWPTPGTAFPMNRAWFKTLEEAKAAAKDRCGNRVRWEWNEEEGRYEGTANDDRFGFTIYVEPEGGWPDEEDEDSLPEPIENVDSIVMEQQLAAAPDSFLADILVRLELVREKVPDITVDPEQANYNLASIVETAHAIGRFFELAE